jgi:hypothetical protein
LTLLWGKRYVGKTRPELNKRRTGLKRRTTYKAKQKDTGLARSIRANLIILKEPGKSDRR